MSSRRCLLEPISEIFDAAEYLRLAVDQHLIGNSVKAEALISKADMPVIYDWTNAIWGKQNGAVHQLVHVPNSPKTLAKQDRVPARMPSKLEQKLLLDRDGYSCCFCSIPLIPVAVRKAMVNQYPPAARWGRRNEEQHSALQAMWLQFDHVLPHSRGGDNNLENIVVTCAPCNYGRMQYTIDELGLEDPRHRNKRRSDWNGLVHFLKI